MKYQWTSDRIWELLDLRESRHSRAVMARKLECTEKQVKDKLWRIKQGLDSVPERPERLQRRCLQCQGVFVAPTRYIRVCTPCKSQAAWRQGNDYEGVTV